jgi:hypothetical protein
MRKIGVVAPTLLLLKQMRAASVLGKLLNRAL